jgi:hypothetical protein
MCFMFIAMDADTQESSGACKGVIYGATASVLGT